MNERLEDYMNMIKESREIMLNEFLIENMVMITDKKNLAMIDAYYHEQFAEVNTISKIKGVFGMNIALIDNLPENVNFMIVEDEKYDFLKRENEQLKLKLAEIKKLLCGEEEDDEND